MKILIFSVISILVVLTFIPFGIVESYGFHEFTSLTTDKSVYSMGESIEVTIRTDWDYGDDYLVKLFFYNPADSNNKMHQELIHRGTVSTHTISTPFYSDRDTHPFPSGNYNTSIIFWDHYYDGALNSNTFEGSPFVLEGNAQSANDKFREKYGLELEYQTIGGTVTYLGLNSDQSSSEPNTLVLQIDQKEKGKITIALPRNIIDAKLGGEDIEFNVSLPNELYYSSKHTEKNNDEFRVLTIEIPESIYGDHLVWIQGTETNFSIDSWISQMGTGETVTDTKTSSSEKNQAVITNSDIRVQGSSDLVGYEITGGKLLSVMPDVDANSLIISVDAPEDGSLTLTIPRSVLDATINDGDDEFFVLVDGEEVDFEEYMPLGLTYEARALEIPFPAHAEEIEVIGTFVIPEFGSIAMLILAVSVISVVVISRRFNVIKF